ncbi:hypothetical protein [Haloferax sp. YSSS75]|uniref:hypothetical protein n=1 Tax=Haloferax sp. YSSS75 TaxID=3388564 RepID=UPI00398D49B3
MQLPRIPYLTTTYRIARDRGPRAAAATITDFLREETTRGIHAVSSPVGPGQPIFEREWDVLVICDAARVDLTREVAPEYDYISNVDTHVSTASYSKGWMDSNFTDEYADEMARTIHVTANPFSDTLDEEQWAVLDEVWRHNWDEDNGTTLPEPLVDRGIHYWRQREELGADRMIIHLMQPHLPFIGTDWMRGQRLEDWGHANTEKTVWEKVRDGEIPFEEMWDAYAENLRIAFDEIDRLLRNMDAEKVAITADHGNLVGEHGLWGHPPGVKYPDLRIVPWIETSGIDEGASVPTIGDETESATDVEDRLSSLGYL